MALEKESSFIKLEKSIIYKEKMIAGARKKLASQFNLL
jgi:hypothetical protein